MQIQYNDKANTERQVVICFKFSNFAYANTVIPLLMITRKQLLFALNLVTLLMQIQWGALFPPYASRCYLL